MKFIGDFKGYNIYSVSEIEYVNDCQYVENKVFAVETGNSNKHKLFLNGVAIGYANLKTGSVIDWYPDRAPKEWKKKELVKQKKKEWKPGKVVPVATTEQVANAPSAIDILSTSLLGLLDLDYIDYVAIWEKEGKNI
jgi:hypothetical protein